MSNHMESGGGRFPVPGEADGGLVPAAAGGALGPSIEYIDAQREDAVNFAEYWRILIKRKWLILSLVVAAGAIALAVTLLSTPSFRATASIQIERDGINVMNVEGIVPTESDADRDFYQTQYELLKSRSLAQRVVDELGLAEDPEFDALYAPPPWAPLIAAVRGTEEVPMTPEEAEAAHERQVVDRVMQAFAVEPIRNSRLVRLGVETPDPGFSQRIVNAFATAFIASNLDRRFDASAYAKEFLEQRLQELRGRLEESERELVEYAQREQIVSIGETGRPLSSNSLDEINTALARAQDDRIRAEARWRQAQSAHGLGLAEILGSPAVQTLQEARAKLQAEYQDKLSIYKPGFPVMQQMQAQLDELQRQINNEVANIKASIAAQYEGAKAQEQMLRAQVASLTTDVLDTQSRSIGYNTLQREVDTNRQLFEGLLQRYKEIGVAGGVGTNNISIVDHAERPLEPFKPQLAVNLAIGLVFGAMLGVLAAFVLEHFDNTIKSPDEVERNLLLAVLGVIPKLTKGAEPTTALVDRRSAFSEAYRSVRTALQFSTDRGVPRCLLVTSPSPSEGKSTTAYSLACNFAQLGRHVLLIDADMRNPSLHRLLQRENDAGLSDYLAGGANPAELLQSTQEPTLSFIAAGPVPPNPVELLASPRLMSLISQASEGYDQVIIDSPPVMGLADAPLLANGSHATLLVMSAGSTRIDVAKAALKRLHSARARVLGVLLNRVEGRNAAAYGAYDYQGSAGLPARLSRG
ncbi:GumC family protein [Coralloluteibacterium stylophorae]|uniref:Polysaccharide biosynthesis tyrosine autokinase n=2 Tax=Coralloluteibacterium stylophorae TaxID=1776034 RepID=A0AAP2CDV9_9GAMM|nr:polysaccharide biosynthesis tyrosine autokinase [Coralloluteibacterium stylophorae]MBS7458539.1 polysaccharide biosynthesis tyrosine autokinase [Coralloluteibacterium stylophorae]